MITDDVVSQLNEIITEYPELFIDTVLTSDTSTYDPDADAMTPNTASSAIKIVIVNYEANEVDGNLVLATDLRGLIVQFTTAPTTDDKIPVNGQVLSIVQVNPIYLGSVVMVYEVQLRV